MERLSGTRYTYTKTRVAFMVPFIFLIPSLLIFLLLYLLSTHAFITGSFLEGIGTGTKLSVGVLLAVGGFIAWDLWLTFQRTVSEEIWITDRDIIWIGRNRRVLLKAAHFEILGIKALGRNPERVWIYEIQTERGKIRFTRSLEHADELIQRIQSFLNDSGVEAATSLQ